MVKRQIRVKIKDTWHVVEVEEPITYPFEVIVDGETIQVEVDTQESLMPSISQPPRPVQPQPAQPRNVGLTGISQEDEKIIRSPMPGRIVSVSVKVWDEVEPGTEVCVLETMKMEQSVLLSHQGVVRAVFIQEGQNVAVGDPLIQLE